MRRSALRLGLVLGMGWGALWLAPAVLAAPGLVDYAHGLSISAQASRPIQEFVLPDAVYAGVTRADLKDLRIFNRAGISVPHAFCPGPAVVSAERGERTVPVFAIDRGPGAASAGAEIDVETAAGTRLRILEPDRETAQAQTLAWIIDAGGVDETIEALGLAWHSSQRNLELSVRIRASSDLDAWTDVVERSSLLRSAGADAVLERSRIMLPPGSYRYLRVEALNQADLPRLQAATVDWVRQAAEPRLSRFSTRMLAPEQDGIIYDAGRKAPVQRAWPRLPAANMLLRIALDSRASEQEPWQSRWTGEAYALQRPDGEQQSSVAHFEPVSARWWRIRVLRGQDTLGGALPQLDLAYQPATLRFIAQGEGPFTLAFGSVRAAPAQVLACGSLLAAAGLAADSGLLGRADVDGKTSDGIGGQQALQPRPAPLPLRRILLWAVLIVSAAVLVLMAARLLRMIRPG